MNKNQTLLEINAAIADMLDSNWSYFSAPSYMKAFFADGIIRCPLYDYFLWPHVHMLQTPQSRKEGKYTWHKNARISCSRNDCKYTWEKTLYRVIILKQMADHIWRDSHYFQNMLWSVSRIKDLVLKPFDFYALFLSQDSRKQRSKSVSKIKLCP